MGVKFLIYMGTNYLERLTYNDGINYAGGFKGIYWICNTVWKNDW